MSYNVSVQKGGPSDKDTRTTMRINGYDVLQSGDDYRWYLESATARIGPFLMGRKEAERSASNRPFGGLEPYPGFDRLGKRIV